MSTHHFPFGKYTLVSTDGVGSVEINGQPWPTGTEAWKAGKLRYLLLAGPGAMLSALEQLEAEEKADIELPSQPVRKLADRLATAVCGDRQIEGYDVELLSTGVLGPRLSALVTEMACYEAEAYALQDQVDEANSSVTALEQRIAELEAQNEKLSQDFAATVGYMNEGCICGRAPAPKHPVDPRLLRK